MTVHIKTKTKKQIKENNADKGRDLFGATRGFISRIEVNNNRLSFKFGQAHSFSILIFQSECRCQTTFSYLNTQTKPKKLKTQIQNITFRKIH